MRFNQDFIDDIEEAMKYWQSQQVPRSEKEAEELIGLTPTRFAAIILAPEIYKLIADKRARYCAEPEPEMQDVEEKGRQVKTDTH